MSIKITLTYDVALHHIHFASFVLSHYQENLSFHHSSICVLPSIEHIPKIQQNLNNTMENLYSYGNNGPLIKKLLVAQTINHTFMELYSNKSSTTKINAVRLVMG